MKYSKDVICGQPSKTEIDTQVQKIKELGATHVAISGFYDNPSCGSSTALIQAWVSSIRAHGLNVWFRMKDLSFEGDYSVKKETDSSRHETPMLSWISANKGLIKNGDIFTPFAEPQNGGIQGVSYCALNYCQFSSASDFNSWLRKIHTAAVNALPGVKVGYYGFDGFMAAGVGNADWAGKSQLEPSTIALMGEVAIDHYPEAIHHTLAQDLPVLRKALGNIPIVISEYGTMTATSEAEQVNQLQAFATAAKSDAGIVGFNYWTLGPSGATEALVRDDYSIKPGYTTLQSFFK